MTIKTFYRQLFKISLLVSLLLCSKLLIAHGTDTHNQQSPISSEAQSAVRPPAFDFFDISAWYFDPTLILVSILLIFYTNNLIKSRGRLKPLLIQRAAAFYSGCLILVLLLASPVDLLADFSFMMHMVQHLGITLVASLLIVVGRPFPYALRGVPAGFRNKLLIPITKNKKFRKSVIVLTHPYFAVASYVLNMWLWHYPDLYDLALASEPVHLLQHFLFFYTSAMVWWNIFPAPEYAKPGGLMRIPYLVITVLFDNALGAVITLNSASLYGFSEYDLWRMDMLEHQQLGGAIMWIGGMLVHIVIMGILFAYSVKQENRLAVKG